MSLPDYQNYQSLRVTLENGVAVLLMDRAKQRNSFAQPLVGELIHIFDVLDRDDRVRVVVLTAETTAPAFCSGADISGGWDSLWSEVTEREGEHAHRDGGGQVTMAILNCRKITMVAVNGHAAGAGMTALQLPFDFRFAWEGAKLTFPFVRRGIASEALSSWLLPRLIGHSRATALMLTGQTLGPSSPHIKDLYYEIHANKEDVFPAALKLARELSANTSQTAVAYTKALLAHPGESVEETHLLESRIIHMLGKSNDAAEGVKSFKERREPRLTDTLGKNLSSFYPWWRTTNIAHRKAKL